MLGAIIGDISGSIHEFTNMNDKNYEFFSPGVSFTDDTVMTCAIAEALMEMDALKMGDLWKLSQDKMRKYGCLYPNESYGLKFSKWLISDDPKPYYSFGNGAAMRVSPVGWFAKTEDEVKRLSYDVTSPTHNHPEGIKGAEATAMCVFLARNGADKDEIRKIVEKNYYRLETLDEIRPTYWFNETCQDTVPQAISCFLESVSFEDAVRNAVSLNGDADTLGAITGSIAEAYYGIPFDLEYEAFTYLSENISDCVKKFRNAYILK